MEEILFRSSQKLENLQVRFSLAVTHGKDLFGQYSEHSKSALLQAWNSPVSDQIKNNLRSLWEYLANLGDKIQENLLSNLDPQKLYYNLAKVLWQKWTKRDFCFLFAGFICGSVVGVVFALSIKKKRSVIRYMRAVQCTNYLGVESAVVVDNVRTPDECGENDVIVSVKAVSVHTVDAYICNGYGKTLRRILQRIYNKHSSGNLPVTLGRDCTGIITDIGSNVKRLEVGDEVWLTVPFWYEGTMSEYIIVPEFRIGRKPKNIGFEGACSLPYSGTLALNALEDIQIYHNNAENKRFLLIGGCTPVGCVLIQILKHWKANITTTCSKRATPVAKALGVNEVLVFPDSVQNEEYPVKITQDCIHAFEKELQLKDKFDYIIVTRNYGLKLEEIEQFCTGSLVSLFPKEIISDSFGYINRIFFHNYVYILSIINNILGTCLNDYDEGHMCYVTLDKLSEMVENGHLQTVVDKVFHPEDIEIALNHIQSFDSIGSTIITFR